MKDVEETIEFFVPPWGLDLKYYIKKEHKQGIHHIARYIWASKVLAKAPVDSVLLDIACGAGFGSFMLATSMPQIQVVGADYDPRAVRHARETYSLPNLKYIQADTVTWKNVENEEALGKYHFIVSFDTLEHLLHREIALVNWAENLFPSGTLIFSTPMKRNNILNPGWEHHKLEYSYIYLYNIMKRLFNEVAIPNDGSLPRLEFWEKLNSEKKLYALNGNPMVCRRPIQHELKWF